MIIKTNPDTDFVAEVKRDLKANGGHCPCKTQKTKDTKCRCKEFKDQVKRGEPGYCQCGLYYAEAEEAEDELLLVF